MSLAPLIDLCWRLQRSVKPFALPMVAYPLAREPPRAESALSKPSPKMDLKRGQREPNVLWE